MRELHIGLRMFGGTKWTAGQIYIQNLAYAIASLPEEEKQGIKLSLLIHPKDIAMVQPIRPYFDNIYRIYFCRRDISPAKLLANYLPFLPDKILNPRRFDFVYPEMAGRRAPYLWGGWIADFQHRHLPGLFSQKDIDYRDRLYKHMAENAPVIILSSRMARDDFCAKFPHAVSRSVVLSFVSSSEPGWFQVDPKITQAKYGLPDRFFLVANQFWQHKDHLTVMEALEILKRQGIQPTVVCTGNTTDYRNPGYFSEILQRMQQLGIVSQIRILGLIPREDMIQLMRRSLAIIQPSRFEGWSTVVEEARRLGKTLLLSDFPVHVEQNPRFSNFFECGNPEALAELLREELTKAAPGPHLERETLSRRENHSRLQEFGRQFLQIVRRLVSWSRID